MKKIFLSFIFLLMMTVNIHAQVLYNAMKGSTVTHRSSIASNDSSNPAIGSGIDMSNFKYAILDIVLVGSGTPTFDITPLFAASGATVYVAGEKRTISTSSRFKVEVNGTQDFYIKCDGKSGNNPEISVYVTGVTE